MTPTKILLVDDEVEFIDPLKESLEAQGYAVVTATDGVTALELVRAERPDVILLDLILPKMDGYEVLKRLKADEVFKRIPVLVLTAREETQALVPTLDEGAHSYCVKPLRLDILLTLIRAVIKTGEFSGG